MRDLAEDIVRGNRQVNTVLRPAIASPVTAMAEAAEEPAAPAREKAPPCGFPGCPAPEQDVRMQFIPSDFREREPGKEIRDGATSFHRKKAECARYFGFQEEAGKPGRKAKQDSETTCIPVGKRLAIEPCPPIIEEIDELWGIRCAHALP